MNEDNLYDPLRSYTQGDYSDGLYHTIANEILDTCTDISGEIIQGTNGVGGAALSECIFDDTDENGVLK